MMFAGLSRNDKLLFAGFTIAALAMPLLAWPIGANYPDLLQKFAIYGIFAIGFPAHTGGAIQFIRGEGGEAFAARARQLAASYGARFAVPDSIYDQLASREAAAA